MLFLSHLMYALFSWIFALFWVDWKIGAVIFIFHMFPLVDAPLKNAASFEPFHTLLGYAIVNIAAALFGSLALLACLVGYTPHFILDFFTDEGIQFLYPRKTIFAYPVKHADAFVQIGSSIGILIIGIILLF